MSLAASTSSAQSCPDECSAAPTITVDGSVPTGVDWQFNFDGTPEDGTAIITILIEPLTVTCPTCTPCKAELSLDFQDNGTGATACYSPSGGSGWWGYPGGERAVDMSTNCDEDSQVIMVELRTDGGVCGSPGADLVATAKLDCYCLNTP